MKTTNEIMNSNVTNNRMTSSPKKGQHSSLQFILGAAIPTHTSQLKKFTNLDCIGKADVEIIDSIMKSNGYNPNFRMTKSGTFCRLINFDEFKKSILNNLNK
jgi:hypothetical protein